MIKIPFFSPEFPWVVRASEPPVQARSALRVGPVRGGPGGRGGLLRVQQVRQEVQGHEGGPEAPKEVRLPLRRRNGCPEKFRDMEVALKHILQY